MSFRVFFICFNTLAEPDDCNAPSKCKCTFYKSNLKLNKFLPIKIACLGKRVHINDIFLRNFIFIFFVKLYEPYF